MKSKFTASNTGIARIGTYDSFVEENDGKPVDIGYALNLITSDDLAFKAVAVVDKLPSPKDAAPGLFYQLDKDFYTLNSKEDGFDKVILGADTTLGLTNNLQQQIDTLEAASDVADVVGTKAELDSYPTENLTDRAIVEVMRDESQSDATAYYRYDLESKSFSLVGVLGVYYTKSEADAKFATKNDVTTELGKINNIAPLTVDLAPNSIEDYGLSAGYCSSSPGEYSVGIGPYARASSRTSIAIGSFSSVASLDEIDDDQDKWDSVAPYSVSIGSQSIVTEPNVVSFGHGGTSDYWYLVPQFGRVFHSTNAPSGPATRRLVNVTDPTNAQDAATKNYVDTQLTPINAKLQYVPENTNQILSQIETNVEKAQSAAEAKVASITAGAGIAVDDSTPTAPVISTTGLATQASVDALTGTVNSKADQTDLDALEATVANKADTSALTNYATKTELNAKADQSAVDAKVSSVTAGTGISITGAATTPTISVNSEYITQQINTAISSLQSTVDNLNGQIEAINSTLATLNERVSALENPDTGASS